MSTSLSYFKVIDTFKCKLECKLCGYLGSLNSTRRRLEHLLRVGTAVKACSAPRTKLSAIQHAKLEEELAALDHSASRRKTNKAAKEKAIADMELSARPRKQAKLSKFTKNKDVIDMDYTRMLVTTACKSGFMESAFLAVFFLKYFNYEVPKRTTVMGPLLDALYKDTKKKVLAVCKFDDPDSLCTISMDGWVSPTGEHIRNYMLILDSITFFYSSTSSGSVAATGEAIGTECLAVIEDVGDENVAGIANDNASAETTSWETIRDAYAHILCTGCTAHGGMLLFKDVCGHAWAAVRIDKVTFLAKFMKNHTWTSAEIKTRSKAKFGTSKAVIVSNATRFAGVYYVIKRMLELRGVMRELVNSEDFDDKNYSDSDIVQAYVGDAALWKDLANLLAWLKPVKCFIRLMDHDCHTTQHVFPGLKQIHDHWTGDEDAYQALPTPFKRNSIKEHKKRWEWMLFDVHCAAYALSPEYHSANIFDNATVMKGLKAIIKFFATTAMQRNGALAEFATLKNNADPALFDNITTLSSKHWFQLHGAQWPNLQPIALRVFSIGTSSCPSERNFSTFSHIWSKNANSLTHDNAHKLVYCYFNIRALQKLKDGTGRSSTVEHGWLASRIEGEDD